MKRSMVKPVPEDTKLEHGWLSQVRCPNGGRNCSPTSRSCLGRRVALWLPSTVHKTKPRPQQEVPGLAPHRRGVCGESDATLQELKVRRHRNIAAYAYQGAIEPNKAKGRRHLSQRPFVLFTDFRRPDSRRHFPPIFTDIAEDKKRPPVLLFQIP